MNFCEIRLSGRYLLFGPPGIGKSTTIKYLKRLGYHAIDLEDYPADEWDRILSTTTAQFIGAAGVHPTHPIPDGISRVLLWVKQSKYDQRRAVRDKVYPSKASQRKHTIEEWRSFHWDFKVKNSFGDCETWRSMAYNFLRLLESAENKQ